MIVESSFKMAGVFGSWELSLTWACFSPCQILL